MRLAILHRPSVVAVVLIAGCGPTEGERFRDLRKQINALKVEKIELEERLETRDASIAALNAQVENLRTGHGVQPEPVFQIDHIRILDITGGTNLDGQPGDDAVTVYFRPIDRDGDTVKRAGRIEIALLDTLAKPRPRVLGRRIDDDPIRIRELWYGRFWTDHYKVVVPFTTDELTPGQEVEVQVQFIEFATGRPFAERKVIKINRVFPEK